jgi:hypothetical protein
MSDNLPTAVAMSRSSTARSVPTTVKAYVAPMQTPWQRANQSVLGTVAVERADG